MQPPSGGCVLKHNRYFAVKGGKGAAAFGRLCVETRKLVLVLVACEAAAFGRLCVETFNTLLCFDTVSAAAFGRLCVETTQLERD